MSFKDWLFTNAPEPSPAQPWGLGHILTLIGCIVLIICITYCFKNKSKKTKRVLLWFLTILILIFEISRRVVNFAKATDLSFTNVLSILLPRPWCAISCWAIIFATIFNKKFLYNFACIIALLGSTIFFAYPGVGFRAPYFLFDDLYSVATHCLLLITSISLMTLGITNFRFKKFWKVIFCYIIFIGYSLLEIYVLKIENDPMYFMQNNVIQNLFKLNYNLYLKLYIIFTIIYLLIFPTIQFIKDKKRKQIENN